MELKILEEKKNPLFNRTEYILEFENEYTPSYNEVLDVASKKFKIDKLAIKIIRVTSQFGVKKFKVEANVYPSKEEKDKIEYKAKKDKAIEEAMAKEAEEAAKPKEEVSEENKGSESKETKEEKTE